MPQKHMWIGWAAAVAIVVTVVVLWRSQRSVDDVAASDTEMAWYTVDDGNTWFSDFATRVPPFEHEGKTAVRCYVFTCDDGATKFVAYLERSRPEAKKALEESGPGAYEPGGAITGMEVKKPGDASWLPRTHDNALPIMRPRCANGETPEPVLP